MEESTKLVDESTEALWYVVHTYSGYENKVATNLETIVENRRLQELIHEVKVPVEMVPELKDGKERIVERKLFPGYVLVKMVLTDESWHLVRNSRGCTGFVGSDGKPVPLTEQEILDLGVERREISVGFELGDTVKVIDGPLEGFLGTVDEIDPEGNSVRLIVSMFGRETPIDLELDQVEPVKEE